MIGQAIAVCIVLIVVSEAKTVFRFLFRDPCKGSGNFRAKPNFQYEDEDDEEQDDRER
jgi:hypothetical protein